MIRLTHPQHGFKDAYSDVEVIADEENGWRRVAAVQDEAPIEVQRGIADIPDDSILSDDIRTQYIAKFGIPPHHRMKPETIIERLKE